ncbi:hypothetical protein PUN28_000824 [Cardiocondyla obscurior]|uniref:Geminin n=1 Tax=Cardiocondyla obscurior TaxID=286306 RepID=A0AAW2H181_9HYME
MKPVTDVEAVTTSEQDKVRKSLHELQPSATDKETLVGADRMVKSIQKPNETKQKNPPPTKMKKDVSKKHKKVIPDTIEITPEEEKVPDILDLITKKPGELSVNYWQDIAEKRRRALEITLKENKNLNEHIEKLEEEKKIYEEMLDDARALIEVLQEMVNEGSGINDSLEDRTF